MMSSAVRINLSRNFLLILVQYIEASNSKYNETDTIILGHAWSVIFNLSFSKCYPICVARLHHNTNIMLIKIGIT